MSRHWAVFLAFSLIPLVLVYPECARLPRARLSLPQRQGNLLLGDISAQTWDRYRMELDRFGAYLFVQGIGPFNQLLLHGVGVAISWLCAYIQYSYRMNM
jgi:hypothetical protein